MNLLIDAIQRVLPRANKKAHDFSDVERLAKREKIRIISAAYRPDILGYYATRRTAKRAKRFIMINSLIESEAERTFVGLHEIAHHFLHAPISWRQPMHCMRTNRVTQSKHDQEADAFALIAMVPAWLLLELRHVSFASIEPEMLPFLIRRQKLWETYGI